MRGGRWFVFVSPFLAPFSSESPSVGFGPERMGKAPKKLVMQKKKQGSELQESQEDQRQKTQKTDRRRRERDRAGGFKKTRSRLGGPWRVVRDGRKHFWGCRCKMEGNGVLLVVMYGTCCSCTCLYSKSMSSSWAKGEAE